MTYLPLTRFFQIHVRTEQNNTTYCFPLSLPFENLILISRYFIVGAVSIGRRTWVCVIGVRFMTRGGFGHLSVRQTVRHDVSSNIEDVCIAALGGHEIPSLISIMEFSVHPVGRVAEQGLVF